MVSAALSEKGPPWKIVRLWHEGAFELIASNELLHELQVVLLRRKFRRHLTESEALEYILWLREGATLAGEGRIEPFSKDPDDYLIALARNADYLVSGDWDLLDLEEQSPPVISPRRFYEMIKPANEEG